MNELCYKVWLSGIFICSLLSTSCAMPRDRIETVSTVSIGQDTVEMEPDFSYVVEAQKPHIFVDVSGYRINDKKVAFFYGEELTEEFEIHEAESDRVVYSGKLSKATEVDGKELYTGIFTEFLEEGNYYLHHKEIGDSYDFMIKDDLYDRQYKQLENLLLKEKYTDVSSQAYLLANYMFMREIYPDKWINESYIKAKMQELLAEQDAESGAFYKELRGKKITIPEAEQDEKSLLPNDEETVSLSTTAQMAGVLAQYVYLYKGTEEPVFINQCLLAATKAYKYVEKYRDNTATDAWYYAAVQLYRTTRQYKYRNAIAEYDMFPVESRSSTEQGYTVLADFAYLSTPYGTDYRRCEEMLDSYIDKAQNISISSSRENFYVLENISIMSDCEILEDMFIMGVVNYVLSGQEYAGVQKNYIHYLSGVNMELKNYLQESIIYEDGTDRIDTANAVRLLVVYGNLRK